MVQTGKYTKNKGGRPKKEEKRDQVISIKCSLKERAVIEERAKTVGLTVSEFLRETGLTGNIDGSKKVLPKEVLMLTATLNHTAANLNQIAKRRNGQEVLTVMDRSDVQTQSADLKQLVATIKSYLK